MIAIHEKRTDLGNDLRNDRKRRKVRIMGLGAWKPLMVIFAAVCIVTTGCMDTWDDYDRYDTHRLPVTAYCEANVQGVGWVDVENDYIPRVVACENGAAPFEALKAQAVTARSYLYYKMDGEGSIGDGQHDQVYTCGNQPQQIHYDAAAETAGQVIRYSGVTICSFYVAGAIPSTSSCIPAPGDPDSFNTERFVTYNEGYSGDDVEQSTLGWVNPSNVYNRGCMSQNGSSCLDSVRGYTYRQILNFYYGEDIAVVTAVGPCVDPVYEDASVPVDSEVIEDAGFPEDASFHEDAALDPIDAGEEEYDADVSGGGGIEGGCGCRTATLHRLRYGTGSGGGRAFLFGFLIFLALLQVRITRGSGLRGSDLKIRK